MEKTAYKFILLNHDNGAEILKAILVAVQTLLDTLPSLKFALSPASPNCTAYVAQPSIA